MLDVIPKPQPSSAATSNGSLQFVAVRASCARRQRVKRARHRGARRAIRHQQIQRRPAFARRSSAPRRLTRRQRSIAVPHLHRQNLVFAAPGCFARSLSVRRTARPTQAAATAARTQPRAMAFPRTAPEVDPSAAPDPEVADAAPTSAPSQRNVRLGMHDEPAVCGRPAPAVHRSTTLKKPPLMSRSISTIRHEKERKT